MSKRGTRKATMRAWAINAYGGPERMQIMELPVPEPRAGRRTDPDGRGGGRRLGHLGARR